MIFGDDDNLRAVIKKEIKNVIQSLQMQGFLEERRERGLSKNPNSLDNSKNVNNRFNAQDLEFFHSNASKFYEIEYVIHSHKETIFRKVYIFNKRVHDYALLVDEILVKDNLSLYFRRSTFSWYLKKIDDFRRRAFKEMFFINFIDQFAQRFKMSIVKTMDRLYTERYILNDATKEKKSQVYLQNIQLYATISGINNRHA